MPSRHGKNWWYVDQYGRKIGYMWPEDFRAMIDYMWNNRKGTRGFSEYTGLDYYTVHAYTTGTAPIPKSVAVLVEALYKLIPISPTVGNAEYIAKGVRTRHKNFPKIDAYWLEPDKNTAPYITAERAAGLTEGDPEGLKQGPRNSKQYLEGTHQKIKRGEGETYLNMAGTPEDSK